MRGFYSLSEPFASGGVGTVAGCKAMIRNAEAECAYCKQAPHKAMCSPIRAQTGVVLRRERTSGLRQLSWPVVLPHEGLLPGRLLSSWEPLMRHGPWSWTLPTERRPREGHRAAMATKLRTLRVDRVPWENA